MKQTEKLDSLIKKILKEELEKRQSLEEGKIGNIVAGLAGALTALGIGAGFGNALEKKHQRNLQSQEYQAKVRNLEDKLNIKLVDKQVPQQEPGSGKDQVMIQAPDAWRISPTDFSKIDSLYQKIILDKYPEFSIENSEPYSTASMVKPSAKGYENMQSLIRAMKLGAITQAMAKDSEVNNNIKEEELEETLTVVSKDGTVAGIENTSDKIEAQKELRAKRAVKFLEPGKTQEGSEEEKAANTEIMENEVKASDIAGQVSEIVDKLKTMAEGGKDPRKEKLAAKAVKQMESAKAALEALTAHEMMLEEKAQAEEEKEAEKHVGKFKKALTKLVKEPAAVEKISAKMTPQKMADLKRKMKSGELDEEKLARVMLQHSLKEGWVKKNFSLEEAEEEKVDINTVKKNAREEIKDPSNKKVIQDLLDLTVQVTGKDPSTEEISYEDAKSVIKAMASAIKEEDTSLTKSEKKRVSSHEIKKIVQFLVGMGMVPLAHPYTFLGLSQNFNSTVAGLAAVLGLFGGAGLMAQSFGGGEKLSKDIMGKRQAGYNQQKNRLKATYNKLKNEIEDYWDNYKEDPNVRYSYKSPQMIQKEKSASLEKLRKIMQDKLDKVSSGQAQSMKDLEKELKDRIGFN